MIHVASLVKDFYSPASWGQILRGQLHGDVVRALDGVSLDVGEGEIVGLCGPNGAGKSTLLRVLAGLVLPTSGVVTVCGADARLGSVAQRQRVSYVVGDERSFSWRLSGRQNLEFFAALHGQARQPGRARVRRLIDLVGMTDCADRPFREYSTGMRQRFVLARGLLSDPRVLLLDEPTRGLDPAASASLRVFIRDDVVKAHGRTVLCATHDLGLVKAFCDRVLVIAGGRVTAAAAPTETARLLGVTE
ncbi:MAG: ABC transporter ATP-binding protein [Deltaproteobacteria bacterium]|nr:ABC transporter ATP-binding protein [Deltaproteobacteria bacterium]